MSADSLSRELEKCLDLGRVDSPVCLAGYCLGTGNTVANYIPLDNYPIMLDEGRKYGG